LWSSRRFFLPEQDTASSSRGKPSREAGDSIPRGFDPNLNFDDIELIRRLSKQYRFGIVNRRIFVSDRRYREYGVLRMFLRYLLMSFLFATSRFGWANRIDYEFGDHVR
jgi:hypothetical protein